VRRWRRAPLPTISALALVTAVAACGGDACDDARRAQQKIEGCLQQGHTLLPIAFDTDQCKMIDSCLVDCVLRAPTCASMACGAITDPNSLPVPSTEEFCKCATMTCAHQ
jgi:hypothetical protein